MLRTLVALLSGIPVLLAAAVGADEVLSLVNLEGDVVLVRPAPGETLFVHFWATWCHSCVEELPALEKVAAECSEGPARVIAVNAGDPREEVEHFLADHGIALPVLRDPKGAVWRAASGEGLPLNLVMRRGEAGPRVELGPRSESAWRDAFSRAGCSVATPPDSTLP